jgi:hypothetical protein
MLLKSIIHDGRSWAVAREFAYNLSIIEKIGKLTHQLDQLVRDGLYG